MTKRHRKRWKCYFRCLLTAIATENIFKTCNDCEPIYAETFYSGLLFCNYLLYEFSLLVFMAFLDKNHMLATALIQLDK